MRRLSGLRAHDDRGAVAVLVAILLSFGILSGLLAIVVDLGRVYAERRVVQNAADAGALAMAEYCAEGDARCVGDEGATWLNDLAGANSPDAASAVIEVCGTGALGTCTPTTATWKDCQPVTEGYANYARVRTSTKSASGDLFFPAIFAGMMDDSGSNELAVGACAQAAWGPARWATVPLPFLLPICPGYPGGGPIVIEDFDPNDPNQTCTLNGVTYDLITKGMAFADYNGPKKDCTTPVKVGLSPPDIPVETSLEQLCGKDLEPVLKEIIEAGQPVILPVIGGHPKAGQGQYEFPVISFKSFTLLGYNLKNKSGGIAPQAPAYPKGWNSTVCGKSAKRSCLYGSVGADVIPGDVGTGLDLGVKAIQLLP